MARHAAASRRSALRPALAVVLCALFGLGAWALVATNAPAARDAEAVAVVPAVAAPPVAPAPAAAPTVLPVTPQDSARCGVTDGACVDLATARTWLVHDGRVTRGPVTMAPGTDTGRVPPGPDSSATPTGRFHVQRKDADAVSGKYGDAMPHAVYFAPYGVAFHEGSLTEGSHGCIHLSRDDATAWFGQLRTGDAVTVY